MRKSIFIPVMIVAASCLIVSVTWASEADELREKARTLKREAIQLKDRGRANAAEDLARKAADLAEAAERLDRRDPKVSEREIETLRGQLKDLLDKQHRMKEAGAPEKDFAEIGEQIARTERALEGLVAGFKRQAQVRRDLGPQPELKAKLEEAGNRIKHLRAAAENLHAAGADDLARQIMEKAEAMERETREARSRLLQEAKLRGGPDLGGIPAQVDELRREVARLREEIREVGQHVKELERARR
jgi:hypothetical protein